MDLIQAGFPQGGAQLSGVHHIKQQHLALGRKRLMDGPGHFFHHPGIHILKNIGQIHEVPVFLLFDALPEVRFHDLQPVDILADDPVVIRPQIARQGFKSVKQNVLQIRVFPVQIVADAGFKLSSQECGQRAFQIAEVLGITACPLHHRFGEKQAEQQAETGIAEYIRVNRLLGSKVFGMHKIQHSLLSVDQRQHPAAEQGKIVFKPAAVDQLHLGDQIQAAVKIVPCLLIQMGTERFIKAAAVTVTDPQKHQKLLIGKMFNGAFFQAAQRDLRPIGIDGHYRFRLQKQHGKGVVQPGSNGQDPFGMMVDMG